MADKAMSLMAQVAENAERLAEGQEERRAHKQALENLGEEVKGVQRKSEEQDGNIGDNTEASQEAKKLAEENKEKLEMLSLVVQMLKDVSEGGGGGSDEGVGNDAEKRKHSDSISLHISFCSRTEEDPERPSRASSRPSPSCGRSCLRSPPTCPSGRPRRISRPSPRCWTW